jgi:hypothetical protein
MTFGRDINKDARIATLDEFGQCLDYLQAQEYNEADTARMYPGEKEEVLIAVVG